MRPALDIGFVALTDAAPLIVAKDRGFFEAEGLNVSLHREVSWATIRDKVGAGLYEGAHMLAPMAIAASGGIGSEKTGLIVPLSLNANSAALGVSQRLAQDMAAADPGNPLGARAFAAAVARHRAPRGPVVSFGVVFPFSLHNYMLRNWALAAGLDPDRDIRIVIAPPTAIVARLRAGEIDGFCVGAPWGALCESEAGAQLVLSARQFHQGAPDKVLGLSETWTLAEPEAAQALTRAILRASLWADDSANANELVELLSREDRVGAPRAAILSDLSEIDFARNGASTPRLSHARWIVTEMQKWGQLDPGSDTRAARGCYRPDIFRAAAHSVGLGVPDSDD